MKAMGFALWIDDDVACAQGTHEYRPMGIAFISATDVFQPRDFLRGTRARPRNDHAFVGLFASLQHVNRYLARHRSQTKQKIARPGSRRQLSII